MSTGTSGKDAVEEAKLGFRFEMALLYAVRLHALQYRKGGTIPYIGHLLGVASLVIEAGGGEVEAIAALLHDAIEDQGGAATARAIEQLFGPRVAELVDAASDRAPGTEERTAENWRIRKEAYLEHLREAPLPVLRISLADKLYNARSILLDLRTHGEAVWGRFHQGRDAQHWYYCALVGAFRSAPEIGPLLPMVEELDRTVREIFPPV